jgi:hypothetical protein
MEMTTNPGYESMLPIRWACYEAIWNYELQHPDARAKEIALALELDLNIVIGSRIARRKFDRAREKKMWAK